VGWLSGWVLGTFSTEWRLEYIDNLMRNFMLIIEDVSGANIHMYIVQSCRGPPALPLYQLYAPLCSSYYHITFRSASCIASIRILVS
jgi:hypothetical protein